MDEEEFARALLAHERREWQHPGKIISQVDVIREGSVVADLACGPGFFSISILKKVGKSGKVYAVDSSNVMLRYLRSVLQRSGIENNVEGKSIEIIEHDISSDSHIPRESVDVILLANILHDISNKRSLFAEINRISKKKSTLVDIDWKKDSKSAEMGPPLDIRLSERETRTILNDHGFKVSKTIDAGPYHYGLVCTKRV